MYVYIYKLNFWNLIYMTLNWMTLAHSLMYNFKDSKIIKFINMRYNVWCTLWYVHIIFTIQVIFAKLSFSLSRSQNPDQRKWNPMISPWRTENDKGDLVLLGPVGCFLSSCAWDFGGARKPHPPGHRSFPEWFCEITTIQKHDVKLVRIVIQFRWHADYDIGYERASRRL